MTVNLLSVRSRDRKQARQGSEDAIHLFDLREQWNLEVELEHCERR
jgi:hypothetical protein